MILTVCIIFPPFFLAPINRIKRTNENENGCKVQDLTRRLDVSDIVNDIAILSPSQGKKHPKDRYIELHRQNNEYKDEYQQKENYVNKF